MSNALAVNNIYFGFIHGDPHTFLPAKLTKFFTKSDCFHCSFVDLYDNTFIDMNLLPRKTHWPCYTSTSYANLYPVTNPALTRAYLEHCLKYKSRTRYDFKTYMLFGFRWLYELLNKPVPNGSGAICSEMIVDWSNQVGYTFPTSPVFAPGPLEDYIRDVLGIEPIRITF